MGQLIFRRSETSAREQGGNNPANYGPIMKNSYFKVPWKTAPNASEEHYKGTSPLEQRFVFGQKNSINEEMELSKLDSARRRYFRGI